MSTPEECREYYKKNRESILVQKKQYYQNTKERRQEYNERYYKENREGVLAQRRKYYRKEERREKNAKQRGEWNAWFKEGGYHVCQKCGYDTCFAAIEFHHNNEDDEKIRISRFITSRPPTEKNKAVMLYELTNNCFPLCANCHREHHHLENEWRLIYENVKSCQ